MIRSFIASLCLILSSACGASLSANSAAQEVEEPFVVELPAEAVQETEEPLVTESSDDATQENDEETAPIVSMRVSFPQGWDLIGCAEVGPETRTCRFSLEGDVRAVISFGDLAEENASEVVRAIGKYLIDNGWSENIDVSSFGPEFAYCRYDEVSEGADADGETDIAYAFSRAFLLNDGKAISVALFGRHTNVKSHLEAALKVLKDTTFE